jgi:hypothetical protein
VASDARRTCYFGRHSTFSNISTICSATARGGIQNPSVINNCHIRQVACASLIFPKPTEPRHPTGAFSFWTAAGIASGSSAGRHPLAPRINPSNFLRRGQQVGCVGLLWHNRTNLCPGRTSHRALIAISGRLPPNIDGAFIMCDTQKDLAYYLLQAEDYRRKAEVVGNPNLKAALEAVAREYMAKARALDPALELSQHSSRSSAAAIKGTSVPPPKKK